MANPRAGGGRRDRRSRRKFCQFCADHVDTVDYKDEELLRNFISEDGKILPKRMSGNCAKHQRTVATAVKRARHVALLPFVAD